MALEFAILSPAQRSGSTLIQRVFNANPQNLVWGEHGGVLCDLAAVRQRLRIFARAEGGGDRQRLFGSDRAVTWTANATPAEGVVDAALVATTRCLLERLYTDASTDSKRTGFKEVRYGSGELQLLRAAFPNIHMVMIVRDPVETARSVMRQAWANPAIAQEWRDRVLAFVEQVHRYERAWLFRMNDVVARHPQTIETLSSLSGAPSGDVEAVLNHHVSGPPGYAAPPRIALDEDAQAEIMRTCKPAVEALLNVDPSGRVTNDAPQT